MKTSTFIRWFWFALACTSATWSWASQAQPPRYYYVSPQGNDRWSGTLPAPNVAGTDGPVATLAQARNTIRALKTAGQFDRPITVMIEAGTYRLEKPFVLETEDSGTAACPITYTAYSGDRPVFSGGRIISGWTPYQGQILQVTLPEVKNGSWRFRELYCGGQKQICARWPKFDANDPLYGGWAFVEVTLPEMPTSSLRNLSGPSSNSALAITPPSEFRYVAGGTPPRAWSKASQAELKILPLFCWLDDLVPVAGINPEQRTVKLSRPVMPGDMPASKGNRFYIENVLEELDGPGQWCLDTETGTLYFWPPAGMEGKDVIAPINDRLIELRGSIASPIHHLTISDLTLTHTRSTWPEERHVNFHSPGLRGEAIRLENAEDCRVEHNLISWVGGDGVRLQGYSARNQIVGNEMAYIGSQAISLASGAGMNTGTWLKPDDLRRISATYSWAIDNVIRNNHLHHVGLIKKNGGAIQLYALNSVDTVIAHNLIEQTADKGICMQDGYGRVLIEHNRIRTVCQEISDTGAIMTNRWHQLDEDPKLGGRIVIRNNYISDVIGCGAYEAPRVGEAPPATRAGGKIWTPYYTWGIYFDNSGMNRSVYDNLIVGTVLGGIAMPVGEPKGNVFENNILVGASSYQADLRIGAGRAGGGEASNGNRFVRNILYAVSPTAAIQRVNVRTPGALAECDYNIYYSAPGQPIAIAGLEGGWEAWRKLGFDHHSTAADPLFVNPQAGDFRLRPESPAFLLGFHPVDVTRAGLVEAAGPRVAGHSF